MPEFSVQFTPKTHQWDALEATKTNLVTWLCGGWGSGKTYTLAQWCYDMADGTWGDGLLVEPDYDTFFDVFLSTWSVIVPGEGRLWKLTGTNAGNSRQLAVRSPGRNHWTRIYVRSAMNRQTVKRIEGLPTIGWWAMDEPSNMICGKIAFEKSLSRARLPNAHGHNPGLIVGKPQGFNWLADAFGIETDHPPQAYTVGYNTKPGYFIRACRTVDNADNLRDDYDADLRAAGGDLFAAQELDAGIVRAEGLIFGNWYPAFHVIPHAVALRLWERVRRKAGGVDWGFTNPACNLACGLTGDGELIVIDEWYERRRQGEEQGAAAVRLREEYGVTDWHADPEDPGKIDRWRKGFDWHGQRLRLTVHEAVKHWEAGNDLIRSLLTMRRGAPHPCVVDASGRPVDGAPRLYVSDRCPNLRKELGAYTQRKVQPGQPPREGAEGDDHAIDPLRYVVNHLLRGTQMGGLKVDF